MRLRRRSSKRTFSAREFATQAVWLFALAMLPAAIACGQGGDPPRRNAAQTPERAAAPAQPEAFPAPPSAELSIAQARLADRFKRLEEVIGRLAELSAATDPRRAELLRRAIAQSREQDVNVRFEAIVKLLEDERLSAATSDQIELQKELDGLLNLLLKADRDSQLASQRERIRAYLKEVGRLLRLQQGVQGRTEGGDDIPRLQSDQKRVADDTKKLSGTIADNESEEASADGNAATESENVDPTPGQPNPGQPTPGEPAPGQPTPGQPASGQPSPGQPGGEPPPSPPPQPIDRALERLRAAQQQMEQAREKLEQAQRENAVDRQREAIQDLEVAKAELERVLRQLREEEMERLLTQLAARFRRMLEIQIVVRDGTVRIDRVLLAERDHDEEIESARLSRQEAQLVREADKALLLLREEGSSVAFPETIELMRDDMREVTRLLAAVEVGKNTKDLENDIIAALEETIAALEKALKDMEQRQGRPSQSGGQLPEPPLVDKLAELKMIRSLQMRINRRTQRYGEMIGGDEATTDEILEALQRLAERQARVHQAAADLSQGRNVD